MLVARWLTEQPQVEHVSYPGLPECDPTGIVARQMAGPGSVLSFTLTGGYAAAAAVAEHCGLIIHAVSLGGVDTLIQHAAALTHRPVAPEARPSAGLLRLSVGLEDPQDVIDDLAGALRAIPAPAQEQSRELTAAR